MAFSLKNIFSSLNTKTPGAPQSVVGIDLGASSVKVVEIEKDNDFLKLKTYGELQLSPYAKAPLGEAVELTSEQKIEAVVDVLRESNVQAKSGVLTLPLADSFVTTISLTAAEKEDITSRVYVEARKHIPIPLSEVALEWVEVEPLPNTPKSVRQILLAAIQNTTLAESKSILAALKMGSQPAEIELFSAMRAISKDSDESLAIIDFGAQTSKLYISQGGQLRSIHRVRAGGALATQRVAELLSVPFEEAENIKRNYTPDGEHAADVKKAVTSSFERALQEFKRVLAQHELRSGAPLTRVVLSGGSASFHDFASFANYALDRQTIKANPFTKVAYPAFMEDALTDIAPTFSVAIGAALRPFE